MAIVFCDVEKYVCSFKMSFPYHLFQDLCSWGPLESYLFTSFKAPRYTQKSPRSLLPPKKKTPV